MLHRGKYATKIISNLMDKILEDKELAAKLDAKRASDAEAVLEKDKDIISKL